MTDKTSLSPGKRGETAIHRYRASRPISLALADGLVTKGMSVCDYGCGHGGDIRFLKARGIRVCGWDPVHRPRGRLQTSDVVNLGYVLNVIEDPEERAQTLCKAYQLCTKILIVSVRVDRSLDSNVAFSDGCLTNRGTFQKIYKQSEFLGFVAHYVGKKAHPASLGIAYVIKDEQAEASYIANRAFTRRLEYRSDLIEEFAKNRQARKLVRLANKLGRLPVPTEFGEYDALIESFGSMKRIERLLLRHIDPEAFQGSREQRKEDIQTYMAMLRLRGVAAPTFKKLPASIQADVRSIWKSYAKARSESEQFLFSLGDPDLFHSVCQSAGVGKLVARDLYIHTSAEDDLPALLRLTIFAAKQIVGEVDYNIIKIATDGRKLSFLYYQDFDEDPHPCLRRSIRVYLPRSDYSIRHYTEANVPILHRKETMVSSAYPLYDLFRQLTEQEDQLGLLNEKGIGYHDEWEKILRTRHLEISHHRVISEIS